MKPFPVLPGPRIEISEGALTRGHLVSPSVWPPEDDFPVVVDRLGSVVSRFSDSSWDLTPWAGKRLTLNFGDGKTRGALLTKDNAVALRVVSAWWLFGPDSVATAATLATRHQMLKPLFALCSKEGISIDQLSRFPRVQEAFARAVPGSHGNHVLSMLEKLWSSRDSLGFIIVDEAGLRRLSELLPERRSVQTAYIPPRIWTYQVLRLRECIDDYLAHQERVEAAYRFCLDAYATNAGGHLSLAFGGITQSRHPFHPDNEFREVNDGRIFHGTFRKTADRFGIYDLLDRWVNASSYNGIKAFSSYLSLISQVGLSYAMNFSLMRVDEGGQLRTDCYSVERDDLGEDIHLLGGPTTKTLSDRNARWIVSPTVKPAVDAMVSVARLRVLAAKEDPRYKLSPEEIDNPLLQAWGQEPWIAGHSRSADRKVARAYGEVVKAYPKLFDNEQLRITASDLDLARRMTFGLDPESFCVGAVWPIAWHQLRRTGAVNMLSTGLVSEPSLQYQLKHSTRAMSRYYGQGHYRLNAELDEEARGYYIREMYQCVAREFQSLQSSSIASPHGERRKTQILSPITAKDHSSLVRDAQAGTISYRETFLGGCANPGPPCPLGGISNIAGCMGRVGESACEFALLDKRKRPMIEKLSAIFQRDLHDAPPSSMLQESLSAQLEAAEKALNVLDNV